jgi:hypothetical protein
MTLIQGSWIQTFLSVRKIPIPISPLVCRKVLETFNSVRPKQSATCPKSVLAITMRL